MQGFFLRRVVSYSICPKTRAGNAIKITSPINGLTFLQLSLPQEKFILKGNYLKLNIGIHPSLLNNTLSFKLPLTSHGYVSVLI